MKKIILTEEQKQFIKNNSFEKISDIAEYIGCGISISRRILKENGIEKVNLSRDLSKHCPNCETKMFYNCFSALNRAIKNNTVCKECYSIKVSGIGNSFYGKEHSKKTKNKISEKNKGKHYSPNTEFKKGHITDKTSNYDQLVKKFGKEKADKKWGEFKEKLSKRNSGKGNPMHGKPSPIGSGNGWSGWYKNWYFRSLLELSYMIKIIERYNLNWEKGEQQKYKIKYIDFEGTERNYFPDFILENKYIIECKPKNLWKAKDILSKKNAGEKFARENNLIYKITEISKLTDKEIRELIENKEVKLLKKYEKKFKDNYLSGLSSGR